MGSGGVQVLEVTEDEDGLRLDRWFKARFPEIGFGQLQKLLRTGQIRIDGGRAKGATRVASGQAVRVPPVAAASPATAATPLKAAEPRSDPQLDRHLEHLKERVLHMDEAVLVIDKPAGLAVQGGSGTRVHVDALLDGLRFGAPERPRLVHRLDKDTSGVLALARTAKAARVLTEAFRAKAARKLYWAVTVGVPPHPEGVIDLPIGKRPGRGGEKMMVDLEEGKRAETRFRILDQASRRAAWCALEPLTGRTHQLRVHLAEGGCPILGDGKYGGAAAFLEGGGFAKQLHLHARRLAVRGPAGLIDVTAPAPPHLTGALDMLGLVSDASADDLFEDDGERQRKTRRGRS